MKDKIVSFETAKLLNELGFNWDDISETEYFYYVGNGYAPPEKLMPFHEEEYFDGYELYRKDFTWSPVDNPQKFEAPTQSLAQEWLRQQLKFEIWVEPVWDKREFSYITYLHKHDWPDFSFICWFDKIEENVGVDAKEFKTYQEALESGLIKACEYLRSI